MPLFSTMSTYTVIQDEFNPDHELKAFINSSNRIYMQIQDTTSDDPYHGTQFITLSKEDANSLITQLTKLISEI